jgi:hypothetical protein
MRQYNGRLDPHGDCITDDMANAIAMRADIHRAFDECRFILVRKDGLWVARFLELTYELGRMHHNRPPELKPGVSAMFLLVRLAWAIFPHARACLEAGGPKLVRVWERTLDGIREIDKVVHPVEVSRIDRGWSASPRNGRHQSQVPIFQTSWKPIVAVAKENFYWTLTPKVRKSRDQLPQWGSGQGSKAIFRLFYTWLCWWPQRVHNSQGVGYIKYQSRVWNGSVEEKGAEEATT